MGLAHWRKQWILHVGNGGLSAAHVLDISAVTALSTPRPSLTMPVNAPRWFRWLGYSLIALRAICTAGCNSTNTRPWPG